MATTEAKAKVREHWENEVCGSRYGFPTGDRTESFAEIDRIRYEQDYMLKPFARFEEARGKRVLEVGLGTGADFANWVRHGAEAHGRDLTESSVKLVRERLALEGLEADVERGDAENLDFPDDHFDIFYSWGVLMCTPDVEAAFTEAHRVLKPGGSFKIMLYRYPSVTGFLIWLLYGPGRLNFKSIRELYPQNVESPGTKVYKVGEARQMIERIFGDRPIEIKTYLGAGDLLTQKLSPRYPGRKWRIVQALYPRWFVKLLGHRLGTVMTIHTVK